MADTDYKKESFSFRNDKYWIAAMAALPLLYFFPSWLAPMTIGDNIIELEPHYAYIFKMLRSFHDPVWNPYLFSGFPSSSYPSASMYNLLAWTHLIPNTVIASNLHLLLIYSFAGIGFYLFGRSLDLGKTASFASGTIYSCAGYLISSFPSVFGYGGLSWIGFALASIEMLRKSSGVRERLKWTLIFSLTCAVEFMAGHPFIFVQTCMFMGIYTLFVGFTVERGNNRRLWFGCAAAGIILTPILGAMVFIPGNEFQHLSWRQTISYELFSGASFTPAQLIRSVLFFRGVSLGLFTASIGPVPFLFACYGAVKTKDPRFRAVAAVAALSAVAMMGNATPLPRILYHVPFIKNIAGPERYGVQFTAASAILAGCGLDIILRNNSWSFKKWLAVFVMVVISTLALIAIDQPNLLLSASLGVTASIATLLAINNRMKTGKDIWFAIAMLFFLLNYKYDSWWSKLWPSARTLNPSQYADVLKYIPTEDNTGPPPTRVLPVVDLALHTPDFIHSMGAQNISSILGIHNATGYNPIVMKRYSEMLTIDFIGFPQRMNLLLEPEDAALDLLNVKHIIIPKDDYLNRDVKSRLTFVGRVVKEDEIEFREDFNKTLEKGQSILFRVPEMDIEGFAVVTAMNNSLDVTQESEALKVVLTADDQSSGESTLRAGEDTAEVAYELFDRPDSATKPKHKMARVFPMEFKDEKTGVNYHFYYSKKVFTDHIRAKYCALTNTMPSGNITIRAMTLFNGRSFMPLSYLDFNLGDPKRFEVEETPYTYIWRSKSDTPRAWLAGSAIWLDPKYILETIRSGKLPDGRIFDRWNMALVDKDEPMTLLSGGSTNGHARFIRYTPNEVALDVACDSRSMLVLSEGYYPGWEAEVDGKPERVYQVDYALRGTIVNAGRHEVIFRFRPASVRIGRIISGASFFLMAAVWFIVRRRR